MTTHLYCVLPHALRGTIPAGLSGLSGAQIRALPVEGLVAWVSDVSRDVPLSVDGVRAHDAVVEAALATGTTPVPARFGQRFTDDDACRAALARRAESVESLLATMQGYVEMTVIITPSTRRMLRDLEPVIPEMVEPDAPDGRPGRRYLEALRDREHATGAVGRATDAIAVRLRSAVDALVVREMVNRVGTPIPIRTISHLIDRDAVPDYTSRLEAVDAGGDLRFLVIGPRAPYSFSALSESGGSHGMNLAD